MTLPSELRYTQNFLHSRALVEQLVAQAGLRAGMTVLEVGAGKGIITRALSQAVGAGGRVVAVELDAGLADTLRQTLALPNLTLHHGDILAFDWGSLPTDYVVFSNVPFNITAALLEAMFTPQTCPAQAHLILQTDALIGTTEGGAPAETLKSLLIAPLAEQRVVHHFRRTDFTPQPAVETALFAFVRRPTPLIDLALYGLYQDFLAFVSKDRAGEGAWRRVFSGGQLSRLADQYGLVLGRGLKAQSRGAMLAAFGALERGKRGVVGGAMQGLRQEQAHRENRNRAGGHRRPTRG